jgi:hypothetical protein|tara:strand:- start:185 stop:523 length:339 start_codon:yes stop_codon:yes gene_type:complete
MKKDQNYIAGLEKAISEKYGEEAIENPAKYWTPEKEKKYLEQLKSAAQQVTSNKIEQEAGFLLDEKLINRRKVKTCQKCDVKITSLNDKVFYHKYGACEKCYIIYYEGRKRE